MTMLNKKKKKENRLQLYGPINIIIHFSSGLLTFLLSHSLDVFYFVFVCF